MNMTGDSQTPKKWSTVAGTTVAAATVFLLWKYKEPIVEYLQQLWSGSEEKIHKDYINHCMDIVEQNIEHIESDFESTYNHLSQQLVQTSAGVTPELALEHKKQIQQLLLDLNQGKTEAEAVLANLDQLVIRRLEDGQQVDNIEKEKERKKKLSKKIDALTARWESLCVKARQRNEELQDKIQERDT